MIHAIGFDFDNTLIISDKRKATLVADIFKHKYGITRGVKSAYQELKGTLNREQKLRILVKKFTGKEPTRREIQTLNYEFNKGYEYTLSSCPLVHGIGVLKELRKKTKFMFLLSLENKKEVALVAKHCGLDKYFDEILGGPKSKHDNFLHILKKHKIKAENALYIGDSVTDVQKAKELTIPVIGINTSAIKRRELKSAGATQVIKDLRELTIPFVELKK